KKKRNPERSTNGERRRSYEQPKKTAPAASSQVIRCSLRGRTSIPARTTAMNTAKGRLTNSMHRFRPSENTGRGCNRQAAAALCRKAAARGTKKQVACMLVTGGAGFIGANFVRRHLAAHPDHVVVVLDRLTYAGNLANLDGLADQFAGYHFVRGDVADPADVEAAWDAAGGPVDAVVHFAAESHVDRSIDDA